MNPLIERLVDFWKDFTPAMIFIVIMATFIPYSVALAYVLALGYFTMEYTRLILDMQEEFDSLAELFRAYTRR